EFEAEKPWRLGTLGKILEVPVVGQFADEVTRRIGGVSAGSTYQSSNEQVIKVYPDGVLQVIGNGKATLTVTNRGKQGVLEVVVKSDVEPNRPPIAHVGFDHHLEEDRKSTRLNSSHVSISYAVFCLKKKITYSDSA